MDQANLWTRRSNTKDKLYLSDAKDSKFDTSRFGSKPGSGKSHNTNTASPASAKSPGVGASAFGLGTGAFASFGQAKTPRTPGASSGFDFPPVKVSDRKEEKRETETERANRASSTSAASSINDHNEHPLRNSWNLYYRPPTTSRDKDYEKSIIKIASITSIEAFWSVYAHLKRPSNLPTVSDYHIFKDGIRPAWEDEANKKGGKWIIRLKRGVSDRYWEELLLAIVGDQFMEASDEVCGAVLSVRSGEDVLSIWTKIDGGRNVKIRETIKRTLALPPDTNIIWRSHDESIEQKKAVDEARQQKSTATPGVQRRTSLYSDESRARPSS